MKKLFLVVLLTLFVLLMGCAEQKTPVVTSTIDCVNPITDRAADFGFEDGIFSTTLDSVCQSEGYQCVSGSASSVFKKSDDVKIMTLPLACDGTSLVGWNLVKGLETQGYTYDETLFSVNCCKVNSVAVLN
jgi:hypothetical protein